MSLERKRSSLLRTIGPSSSWLPDDPIPGCGYHIFKTGKSDPFYIPCTIHDIDYGTKRIPQKEADQKFSKNVRRVILAHRGISRALLYVWGYTYIGIVKLTGKYFYDSE